MAIAKYKAVKIFDYKGKEYGLGMEIVLEDADGELLVKDGKAEMQKYLDPTDPIDAAEIEKFSPESEKSSGDDEEASGHTAEAPKKKGKAA